MRLAGVGLVPGRARGLTFVSTEPERPGVERVERDRARPVVLCCVDLAALRRAVAPNAVMAAVLGAVDPVRAPVPVRGPVVGGLGPDLFRNGEVVALDGEAGTVELDGVSEVRVVTSFLERPDGRILLLRRSEKVGSFRGAWAGVSGFLEDPTPEDQAIREIREETGVPAASLTLRAHGRPVLAREGQRVFVVEPFRFGVEEPAIRLDWEHTEFAWVDPAEIDRRPTVPKLGQAWEAVRGSSTASKRKT